MFQISCNPFPSLISPFHSHRDRNDLYALLKKNIKFQTNIKLFLTDMNNVGSMSQFLYAHDNSNYDDVEAARWQAAQVSTISVMNCLGRIFLGKQSSFLPLLSPHIATPGLISDFIKNKYDMPRSYSITIVASLLLVSQIVAANVEDVSHLWIASSILGLAHGGASSLFPTVCLEWFGMGMVFFSRF